MLRNAMLIIFAILAAMKLTGFKELTWLEVFSPIIIWVLVVIGIIILTAIGASLTIIYSNWKQKRKLKKK